MAFLFWFDFIPINWAGIGALMTGTGALLAGIAALKRSRNEGRKEAREQIEWEESRKSAKIISPN